MSLRGFVLLCTRSDGHTNGRLPNLSLAEGELVEFEATPSDKGLEATFVCGPGGTDCKGSDRRPVGKRKTRKIRLVFAVFTES